jgi:hypothetical protein
LINQLLQLGFDPLATSQQIRESGTRNAVCAA